MAVKVTVAQVVTAVAVSPGADTLVAFGDTVRLVAEATDANGHGVASSEFSWSSSDTMVARVDDSGLVTGVDEGMATITATTGDYSGMAEITTVENTDRAALVALYNATDGPNWVDNTNWLTDAPLGEWYGVDTDASGRVVALVLAGGWNRQLRRTVPHGLSGPIPPELGDLDKLQRLDLSWNNITGPIPAETLGHLTNLEELSLEGTELSGPIPRELGNLTSLTKLDLSYNHKLTGIPPELGNLTNLTFLRLYQISASGDSIPSELGKLTNLETLDLTFSYISGPIPPELG
ncbi:MAG: hypothetical protein F4205_05330 [Gemmatimonadetes bacterium]|nr:hypothetical protein [Gemmatimonadota bacterium]